MSYTVLARRYRSTTFGQVVGQEPIAQTLRNAIAQDKVAHAFLFTGTRGVGKTSMARIFARALNAPDTVEDCPEPPNHDEFPDEGVQQRMAEAIMRGEDLNVIEIDGASNNSVDQARQLIANAGLSPTDNGRYKVYIIDEVHMLSPAAFNALLKTMEEPPPHVKFILCTTESHKVPQTIQSRCQRFDFRNIPARVIMEQLRHVLEGEGAQAEDAVLHRLAQLGNGSMRDALSLLDRLISTGEQPMTMNVLNRMLGLPPQEGVAALIGALADGNVADALKQTAALLEHGVAMDQIIESLIDRLHQLMRIVTCGRDSELVELSGEALDAAEAQAQRFDAQGLVHMIALCESLERMLKSSANPRALLDAGVARLALSEKLADITALLVAPAGGVKKNALARQGDNAAQAAGRPAATRSPATSTPSPAIERTTADSPPPQAAVAPPRPSPSAPGSPRASTPVVHEFDADQLWQTVQQLAAKRASLVWVKQLTLLGVEDSFVKVATLPGQNDLARFITDQRCKQLAKLLESVTGRPMRVNVVHDAAEQQEPTALKPAAHEPAPPLEPAAAAGPPTHINDQQTQHQPSRSVESRRVMTLPLVSAVMNVFDASLVGARQAKDNTEP